MLRYLLVLLSVCAFAQKPSITIAPGSDTISHPYLKEYGAKLGFDPVEDNNGDHTFRISYYGTVITVYKYGAETFGDVMTGVFDLDDNNGERKVFTMTFKLKAEQALAIFKLTEETQIDSIPTDKLVKGWVFGFDGITYCLEQKRDGIYSRKNYWTPTAQHNLPEALLIERFKDRVLEIVEMEKLYTIFQKQVPFRAWTNGSGLCVSRILTKKEYREWKRGQRKRGRENN